MGDQVKDSILQFAPLQSAVDEGFWHRLSSLKLNKLGIDDSPIPVTGFVSPCSHHQVSNHLTLLSESLLPESSEELLTTAISCGNRNRCPVPGLLYNTNTLEGFKALDKQGLLREEAKKIWEDIHSGKAKDDMRLLLRFLVISFADLKKWTFHYWFAFPALILDPPATVVNLKPASQWFSVEEAESVISACNGWRNKHSTTDVPFFLLSISPNSTVTIKHVADFEACQMDDHKILFGFYDPCNLPNNPGWPLRNFLLFIHVRLGLQSVCFLCYRESRGFADLGISLVGEAIVSSSQVSRNHQNMPNVVGWEHNNRGKKASRCISLAQTMDPNRLAIAAADLNLKLMRWRALPSLNLNVLSATRCLLLGAGTLGCQVARMLMAWGVRKITLVDSGKIAITAALGFDSFVVMRHGGGFVSSSHRITAEVSSGSSVDIGKVSLTDNSRGPRLGCYFCNDVVAPVDSTSNRTLDQQCTVTRPGLAPIASSLAVELLVGILHHPCGMLAKAEFANSTDTGSTNQPLGILPHQIRGSLSQFSQMTLVGHASTSCTACSLTVVSEYQKRGLDFILEAINHPTYLEDLTGLTELKKSAASFEVDWDDEIDNENDDDCVEI